MATVKDLKEWLNRFPDETIVEFGVQQEAGAYQSYGCVDFITPNLDVNSNHSCGEGWDFSDFRIIKSEAPDPNVNGLCFLEIGEGN